MHKTKFILLVKQYVTFLPHGPGCQDRKIVYSDISQYCFRFHYDLVVGGVGLKVLNNPLGYLFNLGLY